MPYTRTYWYDQVAADPTHYDITLIGGTEHTIVPKFGVITVAGTPMDAATFNNMEAGIVECNGMILFLSDIVNRLHKDGYAAQETFAITLTNTKEYPLNDSGDSIVLSIPRNNTNYNVRWIVTAQAGGNVGDVVISSRAVGGFDIAFDGDATSVDLTVIVEGGLNA